MYMHSMRKGGSESVMAPSAAGAALPIDSSHGSAMEAHAPRSRVRREIRLRRSGVAIVGLHLHLLYYHRFRLSRRGRGRGGNGHRTALTVTERDAGYDL